MSKNIDWAACEADYRTGTFSNRQLAEIHGCDEGAIRYRAKKYGWVKDLSQAVRQATQAKLLRTDFRAPARAEDDAEIIDHGSDLRASVVRGHQKLLAKAIARVDSILGAPEDDERKIEAAVARDLSTALKSLIPLERQAFNLDEPAKLALTGPDGGPIRAITKEMTPQEAADAYAAFLRSDKALPVEPEPVSVDEDKRRDG